MISYQSFPVSAVFEKLTLNFEKRQTILIKADPGAGKSAILPLFLMEKEMVKDKIIMLEPRRMAARSLARFMSKLTKTPLGSLVGYRVKGDSQCSPAAKIVIVTEGVFIRMIQENPFLEGISAVIMDEFHERNLTTDLSFALIRDVQKELNPDLKLLIMTATPEVSSLKRLLPDLLYLECRGRMFSVSLHSDGQPLESRIRPSRVRNVLLEGLDNSVGNILIFFPGEGEIKEFLKEVERNPLPGNFEVLPLYSRLNQRNQDKVLTPGDHRIVVASTSIAETSLTIPDIGCVIDTGLERKPVFDVHAGLSRLMTRPISKASARQRTGRAGRVREGICIRLWNEEDDNRMDDHPEPEILNSDLCSLVLELLLWGVHNPGSLEWIDPPPLNHYHQAKSLLYMLNIIDKDDRLLDHGKDLAKMGLHPRLAHMIFRSRQKGLEQTACALAALLTEGDWIEARRGSDVRLRLEELKNGSNGQNSKVTRIVNTWKHLISKGRIEFDQLNPEEAGALLCLSFPDRVATHRGDRIYQLAGGGESRLNAEDPIQGHDYIIAPLVGGFGDIPRCFLSAPLTKELILKIFQELLTEENQILWDEKRNRLYGKKILKLGVLNMKETSFDPDLTSPEIQEQLILYFEKRGLSVLPWRREDIQFLERSRFASILKNRKGRWRNFSEEGLVESLTDWFIPLLIKGRLEGRLRDGLATLLTWEEQTYLKENVPSHITVPSGSRITIDYSHPESPAVDVRLQELFGLSQTPLIADEIPLLFRLLNPARRPIQVTRDLKNFWENTYQEVRKELRGRYPKHYWPENPYKAQATNRVRPQ